MAALSFHPTRGQLVASWLTFAFCLAAAAWLGSGDRDGFGWALIHDLVQAVGAAALAIGGIGTVANRLAERRWVSATQVIAVDQLHAAVRHAGAVMSAAAQVLLGDDAEVERLDKAFQLPWTDARQKIVEEIASEAGPQVTRIIRGDGDTGVLARLAGRSRELEDHSDGLLAAAGELDSFLRGDHVLPLLSEASRLRRRVRILTDGVVRGGLDEHSASSRAALAAAEVVQSGLAVARRLREPFDQIRREVRNPKLQEELETEEERMRLDESLERWNQSIQEGLDEVDRAMEEVARESPR